MIEQSFGARRCRDSRKPHLDQCPDVAFYCCDHCGAVYTVMGLKLQEKNLTCCEEQARHLVPISLEEARQACPELKAEYKIIGGYNDNAVSVSWERFDKSLKPDWIYLKTFTGGYLKYLSAQKRPPMVFALADTDAFAYCDADPCLECTFRCKRGFEIYLYFPNIGLVMIPLDKMSPYWQSGAKETE